MRRALVLAVLAAACSRGAPKSFVPETVPDAGAIDPGTPDAGTDAGTPDVRPPNPHEMGGLGAGPWPVAPITTYGFAQGLLEAPVAASTDEGENLWVVTNQALYLLQPGEKVFRRLTAADGLHYGPGWTDPPDIVNVAGGVAGECFVGYFAPDTHGPDAHGPNDPVAHRGKMDQVLLKPDGKLEVRRYDFHNSNSPMFWETRDIKALYYDHFHHPGNLYVGSNHGVTRVVPAKWRAPKPGEWIYAPDLEFYGDHVHPITCDHHYCVNNGYGELYNVVFGDFFGLTIGPDGRLWMGGYASAGALGFVEDLTTWTMNYGSYNPFIPAFGDPYPGNPPVFNPPAEGEPVNIRGVAVTPDGKVWFVSGEVESWRGPIYGMASWDGHVFTYYDPTTIGAQEYNILEVQAWPDGRLVLGFPSSGLLVWKPGDAKGTRLTSRDGLPGDQIKRTSIDLMVDPPQLFVPTEGGLAVVRALP